MHIEITLKNYRCFPDSNPACFSIRKGITGFIGVNNSGKSSLLKFFHEFRSLFDLLSSPSRNLIDASIGNSQGFNYSSSITDHEEVFCNTNDRDLEIQIRFIDMNHDILIPERFDITISRSTNRWLSKIYLANGILDIKKGSASGFNGNILEEGGEPKADFTYLFQAFKDLSRSLYLGPFRNAINIGSEADYYDIKVGTAFIKTWRIYKTGNVKKNNEAIYKLTNDIKHIFGFDNLEINPSDDDQSLQIFINGKSYKLSELGSGITQFILVLANAAIKQPTYIFIDEPELNLHPSLQLDFLTTLGSYAHEGTVFSTHNIGLARASADWIYSVRKIDEGKSEIIKFETLENLSEFLGELSFSGYRDIGFDKILLVEGTTDLKAIQQFLRLYRKDHQIVLLPLGGKSLIRGSSEAELQEIKRLTGNVFALIDSERSALESPIEPKRKQFIEMCERIGIMCHTLERRAIENYFTDKAIKIVKGDKYQALNNYQILADISPAWSKTENWRIAREMTRKDLDSTDLGKFLESL